MADRRAATWAAAALAWAVFCLRWFDAAAPLRPRLLEVAPPWLCLAVLLAALGAALARHRDALREGTQAALRDRGLLLVVALAVLFRLPMAWQGAAGYVTPDGALSGLMALDVRDGRAHDVFVPHVPYSGSLKALLTAPLAALIEPARAFALVSVLFYAAFVAAVYRLAQATVPAGGAEAARRGLAAALYAAFAPAFVTRYSLSNDGNYVEVLALGAWALAGAVRWTQRPSAARALFIFLLVGLAFWCHLLAVIPAAAIALFLVFESPRAAVRAAPAAAAGFLLGYLPGLLWNATHAWDSLAYLVPGAAFGTGDGPGLLARLGALVADHLVVLAGYDFGYGRAVDLALKMVATVALVAAAAGVVRAVVQARGDAGRAWRLLLVFTAVNLGLALFALPYIPGNPRYLLFLTGPLAVFLAAALDGRVGRVVLTILVGAGALSSLAQATGTIAADGQWRRLVQALQEENVRFCYTDFHLATKINFLSEQSVTCSSKLGPTTTEYFFRFRETVEAAPEAALVAVSGAAADKLERRLERLGVTYERRDLMKPVFVRLSRKVEPQELFPDRDFPLR